MQKNWFNHWRSEARTADFFLSGRDDDPEAELEASIRGFFESQAQCRFPARFLFVQRELHVSPSMFPAAACEKFQKFHDRLGAKSVSVVFSSYYLNNPSSAFGHSFLRFGHEKPKPSQLEVDTTEKYELLDYGVGYAATTTTINPIFYAVYGLFGFFNGNWTSVPYYYKVREYNDFDSRDLWSYTLNFNQDEIEMLVAHLWELGSTSFDYFYFTRNCSYEILAALEAAKPELNLLERLHMHVIPSDTIQTVFQTPGLVTNVSYRPSIRTQLFARLERLPHEDREWVYQLLSKKDLGILPTDLASERRARILDAALDGADFQDPGAGTMTAMKKNSFKSQLLAARSHVPVTTPELKVEPAPFDRPHLSHGSHRVGLFGGGSDRYHAFTQLNYRFAHHDFVDRVTGYPDYADIEFFSFLGRYNSQDHSVWLEDMSIFQVVSLSPWNEMRKPLSWEVKLGSQTVRDGRCNNCGAGQALLGGGISFSLTSSFFASLLMDAQALGSSHFTRGFFQLSAGPKLRLLYRFADRAQVLASSQFFENFRDDDRYSFVNDLQAQVNFGPQFGVRLIGKNLSSAVVPSENEISLGGLYYF